MMIEKPKMFVTRRSRAEIPAHEYSTNLVGEQALAWGNIPEASRTAEDKKNYKYFCDLYQKLKKKDEIEAAKLLKAKEREENLLRNAKKTPDEQLLGDFVIDEKHCMMYRVTTSENGVSKNRVVANFGMKVLSKRRDITDPNRLFVEVECFNSMGHTKKVILSPEAQTDSRVFVKTVCDVHFGWMGTTEDLMFYSQLFIRTDDSPAIVTTKQVGLQKYDKRWVLVLPERTLSLSTTGEVEEHQDFSWDGQDAIKVGFKSKLDLKNYATDSQKQEIAASILRFNNPQFAATVIGWAVACYFKPRITLIENQFPILYPVSERSSGKTLAMKIICALSGYIHNNDQNTIKNFHKYTPAICRDIQSYSTSMPIIYDEVKDTSGRDNTIQKRWKELVNIIYNSESASKMGGIGFNNMMLFPQVAPVCGCGENAIVDASTLDRVLIAQTSPMLAAPYKASFEKLYDLPLWKVGNEIAFWSLLMSDEELESQVREAVDLINPKIINRQRWNAGIGLFGLRLLRSILGASWPDKELQGYIEKGFDIGCGDGTAITLGSPVEDILENFIQMSAIIPNPDDIDAPAETKFVRYVYNNYLIENLHYRRLGDGTVAYNVPAIWPKYSSWLKETDTHNLLKGSSSSFVSQVKGTPHFIDYKPVRIGNKLIKCVVVKDHDYEPPRTLPTTVI
jgi:hypothetical protein